MLEIHFLVFEFIMYFYIIIHILTLGITSTHPIQSDLQNIDDRMAELSALSEI